MRDEGFRGTGELDGIDCVGVLLKGLERVGMGLR